MSVKVRYFGKFRSVTSKLEEEISFDGGTLEKLIAKLCEMYGDKFRRMIIKENKLAPDVIILVNGKSIGDNLSIRLNSGDIISIMPFVSGG